MQSADFDYTLPPGLIAQAPAKPRDSSRLLVLDRETQHWQHRHFYKIGNFLKPGDLFIVNESKVFKARLRTTDGIEIFLVRPDGEGWIALAKPGRKLSQGSLLHFPDGQTARVLQKMSHGTLFVGFGKPPAEVFSWADAVGEVPVPPYIDRAPADEQDYQTVYAKNVGSVAAPTAGFHFTPELIEKLKLQGIRFANVTLHVGLGTFRPIKTQTLEEHTMHEEWVDVPDETLHAIEETKVRRLPAGRQGRVIAVGTTTVRALESDVRHGFTDIFITPGYQFKYVDALITNFHLPKSTLLVLVSALTGRDLAMQAYADAIKEKYRFYSFGDAMLII